MAGHTAERRYCSCGTRLARDNRGRLCAACRKVVSSHVVRRPLVPTSFWESAELRDALESWHISKVIRAYRVHEFHPEPIAQATVANWFGTTQAHISRIENGQPVTDLAKLIPWALVLGIPEEPLWFKLPEDQPRSPASTTADAGVTSPGVLTESNREDTDMRRRALLHSMLAGTSTVLSTLALGNLAQIEQVRRELDKLLDGPELGDATVERWEALPGEYGQRYLVGEPSRLLTEIAGDFIELQGLLGRRQSAKHQTLFTRVAGQLALLAATSLINLNEERSARAWFHTAGLAAREASDPQLRGLILMRSAQGDLFYGTPESALAKLAEAHTLVGREASPGRVRTLVVEARVLAVSGRHEQALRCLDEAETAFQNMPASALADPALGCTERQFCFMAGNAYTHLGMTHEADSMQRRALSLYRPTEHRDIALTQLDQARCIVRQGDPAGACEHAMRTITAVPTAHRGLITHYGRAFLAELPVPSRSLAPARALHELLTTQN